MRDGVVNLHTRRDDFELEFSRHANPPSREFIFVVNANVPEPGRREALRAAYSTAPTPVDFFHYVFKGDYAPSKREKDYSACVV